MEVDGFRVRLDLSQFFNDIKKFACIYVDLSRDRQIADVVDRISEVFNIERPLFLLDEKFYLPESENVNALRGSNIVKVLKDFHFRGKESCSSTDHHENRSKGVEYLTHEINSEQVSIKNNNQYISENVGSHDLHYNKKADSVVPHEDKAAFHEHRGKKRKHEVFDESKCINSIPEIHYQKKCKRKKEKVKKEILSGSSLEPLEDEIEEKNSNDIKFDNKSNKKKKRNKAEEINGDITEDNIVHGELNHDLLENSSDHSERATCNSKGIKKHKKKTKEDLSSLDAHESLDSEPLQHMNCKKPKKKHSQNAGGTEVREDPSLSLSCDKTDTFLITCSQGVLKYKNGSTFMDQNIDSVANSGTEHHDSIGYTDTDFAHTVVSSTPTITDGCKSTEAADITLEDNTHVQDSTPGNEIDNAPNTAVNIKPKRKRTRVRRHRKRNGIQNDKFVTLTTAVLQNAVLQSSVPPRKHIRFEEEINENLGGSTSHKDVPLNNDVDMRNNSDEEICGSKASPKVNDECTLELTPRIEVTDCPENLINKNNTTSLPNQIPLHQQWALNTANLNADSKDSLQKLLILGKQSSVPVVFERKSQSNNSVSVSGPSMPVSEHNNSNNRSSEETCEFQNNTQVVDLVDTKCVKTNPNAIDPLLYPLLQGKPKKNDIIAFKKLKMTSNYTPEVSGFIIATVLSICEDTCEMSLQIEAGESDLEAPKGKFSLDTEDSEKNDNDLKLCQLNWNELMDVRILFP